MSNFRSVLVLLGALSLAACNDRFGPAKEKTGFISATAYDAGGGAVAMRLLGAFYHYDGLDGSPGTPETCTGAPFSLIPPTIATLPTVSAGQYLYTEIGGRKDTLFQASGLGFLAYQLVTVNAIPYTPGDTLKLEVPGETGGFPEALLKVRTAEAFTHDAVGNPADGQPLTITWTAATSPGSLMVFSLRFNASGTAPTPDTQIYCVFTDDGAGQVSASLAAIWGSSQLVSRSVRATRVRLDEVEIDGNTKVTLFSYFERPLAPVPIL